MFFKETVFYVLRHLRHDKRRTILTTLGLVIGITSVILVMSVGAGAQSLITNMLQKRGTDMLAILAGASDPEGPPAQAMGIVITTLTADDARALLEPHNVRNVLSVSAYISGNDTLQWKNNERNVTYTGTMASYPLIEKTEMNTGRFFDDTEESSKANVMVLGSQIAEELFGNQEPVGEFVTLQKKKFKIIGVLKPKGSDGFENPDTAVLIPLKTAQQDLLGVRHVSFIRLRVTDTSYVDEASEAVRQTLIERHNDEDFSVRNVADALDILAAITNGMRFFLVAVAAVSLFVGGVGIMNIMLIAVKEKTREIGLRKAVGARRQDILAQFLIETIIISLAAGIAGILIGVTLSFAIARVVQSLDYDYSFIISPLSLLVSVAVAGGIGLILGVAPAVKAARLNPVDALRYE